MQVRDLIHLLQTRAKPEQEVVLASFLDSKDGAKAIFGPIDDHFGVIMSRSGDDEAVWG